MTSRPPTTAAPPDLASLREAGRIAAAARDDGARRIVAGARLLDVCRSVEEEIERRGGGLAFPVQSSRNAIAAHYCPGPDDVTVYAPGDLAKLDIGVHVDGWVVDTALTVNVGDGAAGRRLVDAAEAALAAAIAATRADVPVREVSAAIEKTIRSHGVRPMRTLCGHGVGRWTVHRRPPVPNVVDGTPDVLRAGSVVAIEPFATEGSGEAVELGEAEVFRVSPDVGPVAGVDPALLEALRAFRGLPFSRRQLSSFAREAVEAAIAALRRGRLIVGYPPLVEAGGRAVAQAEHTVYVGDLGVEVLTL